MAIDTSKLIDLDRLQSTLLTSKVQQTNNALFQVITQLIKALKQLEAIIIAGGDTTNITQIINQLSLGSLDGDGSGGNESGITIPGPKGDKGDIGDRGAVGLDGINGEDGFTVIGPKGDTGAAGSSGLSGIPGNDGLDGIDGLDGFGIKGDTGATGPAGSNGIIGIPGNDGIDGEDSLVPGPQGNTGPTGSTGANGTPGIPGIDGESNEILEYILLQAISSGGSGTPGGSNTQVQFNDSGAFGGNSAFTFDKATAIAALNGLLNLSGASAGQIKFPATQNPSSDANTFDDYEEGLWSPIDASAGGLTLSFVASNCRYIKWAKLVIVGFVIDYPVNANGSSSLVGGLPFTVVNTSNACFGLTLWQSAATATQAVANQNGTTFQPLTSGGATVLNSTLSGLQFRGSLVYEATA